MRIYNYLFYKSYLLAKRSKNFDDMPVLGAIIFIAGCFMFNIFTVIGLLEGSGINTGIEFKKEYKFVFSLFLVVLLLVYFLYKDRYKKIVEKYEQNSRDNIQLHPIIVVVIYYVLSFGLLLLASIYKNQGGIFYK